MNCGEIREYLFAFLDNEVETGLSMEIQRHLERCPDCAREMEIERTIRRHLARSLEQGVREPALDTRLLQLDLSETSGTRKRSTLKRLFSRRAVGMALCSAALVLAAGSWWIIQSGSPRSGPHGVAEILIQDFQHFMSEGRPLQIASADDGVVSAWLRDQTGLSLSLPRMSGHCKLVGARKCRIDSRPAAFALYEMKGGAASLIVLPSEGIDMGSMQRVEHDGGGHWIDRSQGHTVVACRRGELIYAAVSTLPEEELLHLMSGARHEQDAGS